MYDYSENGKNFGFINILQLSIAGIIIIHWILISAILNGNWDAALLIGLMLVPCIAINILSAFCISPIKKYSLKTSVFKLISIFISILAASFYSWVARAFDYHGDSQLLYLGLWYIPISFIVLTVFSGIIFYFEIKNHKKNKEFLGEEK